MMGSCDIVDLIDAARDLRSDHGSNSEYDRALAELIATVWPLPGDRESIKDAVKLLIEG